MHEEVGATRAFAHSSWGSPADDDEREKGSLGSTSTQRLVKKTAKECHGCRRFQARAVADAPGILPPPSRRPCVEDDLQFPVLTPNTLMFHQTNAIPEAQPHHCEEID
jgi:hypothetical protein